MGLLSEFITVFLNKVNGSDDVSTNVDGMAAAMAVSDVRHKKHTPKPQEKTNDDLTTSGVASTGPPATHARKPCRPPVDGWNESNSVFVGVPYIPSTLLQFGLGQLHHDLRSARKVHPATRDAFVMVEDFTGDWPNVVGLEV